MQQRTGHRKCTALSSTEWQPCRAQKFIWMFVALAGSDWQCGHAGANQRDTVCQGPSAMPAALADAWHAGTAGDFSGAPA